MTNLNTLPLEDDFDTTLAQSWDGATGTVYVNDTPGFTFPSGVTTYIVVNPGKTNMQVAEIDAYDSSAKTLTVSSISTNKGASNSYTQQSHAVGSVVRISDNFQFWEDIRTAMNTKVDGNVQGFPAYADATARDAAITSPVNGMQIYNTGAGVMQQYVSGSWEDVDLGTVTTNASETVAGKVEEATDAETAAGTATGDTGAKLFTTPTKLNTFLQKGTAIYFASSTGSDTYTATMTPTLTAYTTGMALIGSFTTANTGACSINIDTLGAKNIKTVDGNDPQDGLIRAGSEHILIYDGTNFVIQTPDIASETNKGIIEIATSAEAAAKSDDTKVVTPVTLGEVAYTSFEAKTSSVATWTTTDITHSLGVTPKHIEIHASADGASPTAGSSSVGYYDGSNHTCKFEGGTVAEISTSFCVKISDGTSDYYTGTITTMDSSKITITWSTTGTPSITAGKVLVGFHV